MLTLQSIMSIMGWMLVMGVGLVRSSAVTVTQPHTTISTDGIAQIRCFIRPRPALLPPTYLSHDRSPSHQYPDHAYPYPDPEELRVTLLRGLHGSHKICSFVFSSREQRWTQQRKDEQLQFSPALTEGAVELTVWGLRATHTDVYRCKIEVLLPPPYLSYTGNGTFLHVPGENHGLLPLPLNPGAGKPDRNHFSPVPTERLQTGPQGPVAPRAHTDEREGEAAGPLTSAPVVVLLTLLVFVLVVMFSLQLRETLEGFRWQRYTKMRDIAAGNSL